MNQPLTRTRRTTLRLLEKTRLRVAATQLAQGLASDQSQLRQASFQHLLARNDQDSWEVLLSHFGTLSPEQHQQLAAFPKATGQAAKVLMEKPWLWSDPSPLQAVAKLQLVDQFDRLVAMSIDTAEPWRRPAGEELLRLAEDLGAGARQSDDLSAPYRRLLELLYPTVRQFETHRDEIVVDAWLSLVRPDNAKLHRVLSELDQPAWRGVNQQLCRSQSLGVVKLLTELLKMRSTPLAPLKILAERTDPTIALGLAASVPLCPTEQQLYNLSRIATPASLLRVDPSDRRFPLEARCRMAMLLAACDTHPELLFRALLTFARLPQPTAQLTAVHILTTPRMIAAGTCAISDPPLIVRWLPNPQTLQPALLELASLAETAPTQRLRNCIREYQREIELRSNQQLRRQRRTDRPQKPRGPTRKSPNGLSTPPIHGTQLAVTPIVDQASLSN
jgi:hypothetical protein